uniref:Transformer n=1 Tax=Strongyloides venezuelensis TaxID=75913 RepID=A0A0K0EYK0_STRVS
MSRDRKSRKNRSKSRDLESRRRSRRRTHSRRSKKSNSDKKSRSRRQRYTVRDVEKPLSNNPLINGQPNMLGGDIQQHPGVPAPTQNIPQTLHNNIDQRSVVEVVQKPPEVPVKPVTVVNSAERIKSLTRRVKRTAPNLSANYSCFSVSSHKVDGKMVHSVLVTTTENIPKKLHLDNNKLPLGSKNILDNLEIHKICKNIKNGVKFGSYPQETISNTKNCKETGGVRNYDGIFKTKDDVILDDREMFLAKIRSLQDKMYIQ